jgi:hypothetical protein
MLENHVELILNLSKVSFLSILQAVRCVKLSRCNCGYELPCQQADQIGICNQLANKCKAVLVAIVPL